MSCTKMDLNRRRITPRRARGIERRNNNLPPHISNQVPKTMLSFETSKTIRKILIREGREAITRSAAYFIKNEVESTIYSSMTSASPPGSTTTSRLVDAYLLQTLHLLNKNSDSINDSIGMRSSVRGTRPNASQTEIKRHA